jgi:murein DD-endopeptidase MepM/ murein hydrolase activator NlpD
MDGRAIVAGLRGQADLYGALHRLAAGLTADQVAGFLPAVYTALGDSEEARRLASVDQGLLRAVIRDGAGLPAAPAAKIAAYLAGLDPAPLFLPPIAASARMPLLTGGQMPDMPAYSDRAFDGWFAAKGVAYGLGPYGEKRSVYTAAQFADAASPERRMVHLGVDVFAPAGTPVFAPLPGEVAHVTYNADPLDYGHTLILRHETDDGLPFWTLYGHLAGSLPGLCREGDTVAAGQHIADLGDWHENGGWAAHVHFQIMADMLDQRGGNFFGVGHESLWPVWRQICPDPNLILRLPEGAFDL